MAEEKKQKDFSAKVKRFDFKKKPIKGYKILKPIKYFLCHGDMVKHNFQLEKEGMDGIKAPYLLLSNHQSPMDLEITQYILHPQNNNPITALDGFKDYSEFLLRGIGAIGKRKFITDLNLIKNMKYCIDKLGDIVVMYPEARYSLDGTTSYLTPTLGKLVKFLKTPVAVLICKGPMISFPQWNKVRKDAPLRAKLKLVVTAEETKTLSAEEIYKRIKDNFGYDDFGYQKENNIIIDHPDRADGLHSILYQCPHCGVEHEMYSKGSKLWCSACGKVWDMTTLGELVAEDGETEFSHIPDWFKWERENVRKEVRSGNYKFEDECAVKTLPNAKRFYVQPDVKLVHDYNGFAFKGTAYGAPFDVKIEPLDMDSVHIEYDFKKEGDALDISVPDDSYWLYPKNKRDVITKISFATEELHFMALEKRDNDLHKA